MNNKLIHILIIEDEPTQSEILSEILSQENYNISVAEDGSKAIEISKKQFFDILICDYNLPDMNGLKIINNILEFSPESIPILLTGLSSVEIAIKGMRAGIHDYLIKPIEPDELKKTINNILEEREKFKNHKEKFQKLILEEGVSGGTVDFSVPQDKPETFLKENTPEKNFIEKEPVTGDLINKSNKPETVQEETLPDSIDIPEDSKKIVTPKKVSKKKISKKNVVTKKRNVKNKKSIEKEIESKDKNESAQQQDITETGITTGSTAPGNTLKENNTNDVPGENTDKKIIPSNNKQTIIPEIKKNNVFNIIDKLLKFKKLLLIILVSFFFYF